MKAYKLFTSEEAAEIYAELKGLEWQEGKASRDVKRNEEVSEPRLLAKILARVKEGPIPKFHFVDKFSSLKFNRYRDGGEYGPHADASIQNGIRSDLACTVFLNDGYEGGELCVGPDVVKLPAGECIVYECWRPHFVAPVTEGERVACIFWMQSYIRSEEQRDLLGMLRGVIAESDGDQFARLGAIHEKLVKMWWR